MNNTSLNPIVDADHIVYGVGFAVKEEEPLSYALATARSSIHNIHDRFPDREYCRLFLGGKGNFRDRIGTIQVYKGNRDPAMRPKFYDEIRQYMIDYHGAEVVNGMEAEDACGIEQWKHKDKSTVIVAVDKDLRCLPGYHYHPKKGTLEYLTLGDAAYNFWTQVLTGDRTDNILGIPGIGEKKAAKILEGCNRDWLSLQQRVMREYERVFGSDALVTLHETAQLVFILREEGKTYDGSVIDGPRVQD